MSTKTESKTVSVGGKIIFGYIKALMLSLIITFASIILFAFIIKWANLSDEIISPVNLVIKAISVFVGAFVFTRGQTKGIFKGFLFAVLYTLIAFVVFSSLAGGFVIGLGLIADLAFTGTVGAVAGILGVNLKR